MVFLRKKFFVGIIVVVAALGALFAYKAGRTISVIGNGNEEFWEETVSQFPKLPVPEENRIDILLIGIRGYDGSGEWGKGEWLADTIVLGSFNTLNNQAAIISIPRDLYVDIPRHGKDKINAAYAIGEAREFGGGGIQLMKAVVSYVTGVYVDHAVSVDFKGFEKIIDTIGGITVYRSSEFVEPKQWTQDGREGERYWRIVKNEVAKTTATSTEASIPLGWEFYVPVGTNAMNSEEALYYARSRYSSSDFDRMRRQQDVIDAVKSKALNLGVLANPVKIFNILDAVEKNVRMDVTIQEIKDLIALAKKVKSQDFKRIVLESSDNGLLIDSKIDGVYVLLPKAGDYRDVQTLIKSIVE